VAPIGWGGFSLDICAIPPTDWSILSQILSSYNKANQTLAIGSVVYRYGIYIASLKQFKFVSNSNTLHFQFKPIILVSGTPPPNNRIINPVAFSSNPTLAPYYTNQFLQYGKAVFSKTLCDTPASLTSLQVSWTPFSDMPTLSAFPGATNIPAGTVFPTGWGGVKEPQTMRAKYVLLRPTKSRSSTTNYSLGKVNFYRGTTKLTRADLKVPVATFINTTYNPVDTTKGTTLVDVSGRFFRSPTSTEYNIVQKQKDLDNAIAAYNFAKANDPWSYAGVMGPTLIRYAENYLAQALNANGPIFKDNPFYCNWYLTPAQQAAWNRPNDPGVETLFPYIDANLGDFSIVDKLVITNGSTTTEFGIQQFNITWPTGSRSPLAFLPSVVNPFPPAIIVSSCLSIPYSNFYVDGSTNNLFTIKKKVPAYLPNQNPNALLNYGATDFFNVPNQNFSVLFSFNSDVEFDGMSFTTAPGTDRSADLTQWTIECSSDGKTWKPFMTQSTPYSTPNAASTETEVFPYTVITESFANPTANPTLALPFVERPEVLRAVKEYLNRKKVRFEPASYSYHPTTGECQYILEDESIVSIVFTVDGLIDEAASNPRPIKFRGSNQALMLPSRGPVLQEVAAQAPEPTPFSFKHYRIRFLETRDPRAAYVHLGLLRAYDVHKQPIDLRAQGAKITNLLGAPAVDGTSAQVLLSPKGGRWTDTTRSPLQITFPEPTPLRALSFAMPSVPNSSAYDPVRWRVEASESGRHWVPVGEYSYVPSETRGAETPLFVFNYSA
jgi:hypothetical protein